MNVRGADRGISPALALVSALDFVRSMDEAFPRDRPGNERIRSNNCVCRFLGVGSRDDVSAV